jgi:hypothetical protein
MFKTETVWVIPVLSEFREQGEERIKYFIDQNKTDGAVQLKMIPPDHSMGTRIWADRDSAQAWIEFSEQFGPHSTNIVEVKDDEQ